MSMLRFDCCWPYTDEDADKIQRTFDTHNSRGRWEIRLQTGSRFSPTIGRWESFVCEVEPVYS